MLNTRLQRVPMSVVTGLPVLCLILLCVYLSIWIIISIIIIIISSSSSSSSSSCSSSSSSTSTSTNFDSYFDFLIPLVHRQGQDDTIYFILTSFFENMMISDYIPLTLLGSIFIWSFAIVAQ